VYEQNKLVTLTTAAKSQGCDAHLCFLKTSLGQTQSKKKILTTDVQLFKENTKSVSLSNCFHLSDLQDGLTRLFTECLDQYRLSFVAE